MVAVVALAGCGGSSSHSADSGHGAPAGSLAPVAAGDSTAAFNDVDVAFAQGMIPHHEQAVEMAEIALDPAIGASPAIIDIATRIKGAQDPEIKLMTGWLTAWGTSTVMDTSDGHSMSDMEGMMSMEQMDGLNQAKGVEFDKMWATMMIDHHKGAVTMAKAVQTAGSNTDVRLLAGQIIAAQEAEIAELGKLAG
jgi:uncharacterized protein (DUF305 family)